MHVYIFGAAGSGTTTLGRALAAACSAPFFDNDDFFWEKTDPPFQVKTERGARQRALLAALEGRPSWVLAGTMMGWGDVLIPAIDLAVYLYLPPEIRLPRLLARERARYGPRIAPGNDLHATHLEFVDWASRYDTAGPEIRSRVSHASWMELFQCPLLRIEGDVTTEERVRRVMEAMEVGRHS